MSNLRSRLAKDAGADIACPMTTGSVKIVAFAAEENREMGKDVTPYWRVVKDGGKLNVTDGITLHAVNLKDIPSPAKTEPIPSI